MAQSLSLDSAWEKQISLQDRRLVETAFAQAKDDMNHAKSFTYLRHDFNHEGALLIVVLIHNWSQRPLELLDELLVCFNTEQVEVARHFFSLPFQLSAQTSTPWTLIFPKGTYQETIYNTEELSVHSFFGSQNQE